VPKSSRRLKIFDCARGQTSIEYLLLLAALLFFFSLLLPVIQKSYALSFFSADVIAAKRFSSALEVRALEFAFLGDGSATTLTAKPVGEWVLNSTPNSITLVVKSTPLNATKSFEAKFPNNPGLPETTFSTETVFTLRKENNRVLLEYS